MKFARTVRARRNDSNARVSAEVLEGRVLLSAVVSQTLADFMGPVRDRVPVDYSMSKLGNILADSYSGYENVLQAHGAVAADSWQLGLPGTRISNGEIRLEAFPKLGVTPQQLAGEISGLGGSYTQAIGNSVSASVPISALPNLSAIADLNFARDAAMVLHAGSVDSQGNTAMNVTTARTNFGVDGTGVKVGVISDSYNFTGGAAANVTSGDLPAGVQVIQDDGSTDEGRAMMQIVHDLAPGSPLAFATANGSEAIFANNITQLHNAGAKVIVDDVTYYDEAMFQDDVIAQAAEAHVAAGGSYFTSAGNSASDSYESGWRTDGVVLAPGGAMGASFMGGTAFDFDPGAGVDTKQQFTLTNSQYGYFEFQWDQPSFSISPAHPCQNDVDMYILNAAGTQVLSAGNTNNTGGDPIERFYWRNTTGSTQTYQLMMVSRSGASPGFIKYMKLLSGTFSEWLPNSSTSWGHENTANTVSVAAAWYNQTPAFGVNPPVAESFTSRGTIPHFFDTAGNRLGSPIYYPKPDITAVDGVSTTVSGFSSFFGTSAAAPHAAAVAALMYQLTPAATNAQVLTGLRNGAVDMDDSATTGFDSGFDTQTGWGLIQADAALAYVGAGTAVTWTGTAGDSQWSTAGNWSNNQVPTWRTDVTINVAANPTIIVAGTQWAHSISDSEILSITGTLNVATTGTIGATATVTGAMGGAANITLNSTMNWNSGSILGSGTLDVAAAGTLNVGGSGARLMTRSLQVEGTLLMAAGGDKTLVIPGYTRSGTGKIDLNDDDMIVNYYGGSPLAAIATDIKNARNAGPWTGFGLNSTAAKSKAQKNTMLGAMEATDYKTISALTQTFNTLNIDNTAIVVKYTWFGDANFNGKVDGGDYARIDQSFAKEAIVGYFGGWLNGDFDLDGRINGSDYGFIDGTFSQQTGTL